MDGRGRSAFMLTKRTCFVQLLPDSTKRKTLLSKKYSLSVAQSFVCVSSQVVHLQMGVGGLTSFVDDNPHLLTDFRLHDTRVVVDGNNLYHFLFGYYGISYKYGGNLDDFAEVTTTYIQVCKTSRIVGMWQQHCTYVNSTGLIKTKAECPNCSKKGPDQLFVRSTKQPKWMKHFRHQNAN